MAGIFGKIAGFLGWEDKFSLKKTVLQLMLLWIVVPLIVLLVSAVLPKLSAMMANELLPALVGDILGILVNLLTMIADGLKKAFVGLAPIKLSQAEMLELASPFVPQAVDTLTNMDVVYLGVFGAILGVFSGTPQAMYLTMCCMLGENLLRIFKCTGRMKLIVNVGSVFLGCVLWYAYGVAFEDVRLMLFGLVFLGIANCFLMWISLGMDWLGIGFAILLSMISTVASCCYISALEWIFAVGTLSLMQCCVVIFVSGLVLAGLSFCSQVRSKLF